MHKEGTCKIKIVHVYCQCLKGFVLILYSNISVSSDIKIMSRLGHSENKTGLISTKGQLAGLKLYRGCRFSFDFIIYARLRG